MGNVHIILLLLIVFGLLGGCSENNSTRGEALHVAIDHVMRYGIDGEISVQIAAENKWQKLIVEEMLDVYTNALNVERQANSRFDDREQVYPLYSQIFTCNQLTALFLELLIDRRIKLSGNVLHLDLRGSRLYGRAMYEWWVTLRKDFDYENALMLNSLDSYKDASAFNAYLRELEAKHFSHFRAVDLQRIFFQSDVFHPHTIDMEGYRFVYPGK